MNSKTVLITGGSGYVGLKLVQKLSKFKNLKIIATYHKNKPDLIKKNLKWVNLNILKDNIDYTIFKEVDYLYHLAWNGLDDFSDVIHLTNILPKHKKFLKKLISINPSLKKIIVIGTCLEYGSIYRGKLKENLKPIPDISYGIAKYKLYLFLKKLKNDYNFKLDWCRLFYVYGGDGIRNSLWKSLITKKKLNIKQPGTIRDFIHVNKIALILIKIAFDNRQFDILNVCSGKNWTIKRLIKNWIRVYKLPIKVNFDESDIKIFENFWGDTSKLNTIK